MTRLKYDSLYNVVCCLRTYRQLKGLTQGQLSARSGISQNTISMMEHDNYFPSIKTALILADVLEVDVNDLWKLKK